MFSVFEIHNKMIYYHLHSYFVTARICHHVLSSVILNKILMCAQQNSLWLSTFNSHEFG